MRAPLLVDLALLSAAEAERRHPDAWNHRCGRVVWFAFVVVSPGGWSVSLAGREADDDPTLGGTPRLAP